MLKYQYDQIVKQLLLLQDHAAMRFCPYSPKGDFCIWKHLLAVEAYADETEPMDDDKTRKEMLETLQSEARSFRSEEESFLSGSKEAFGLWLEDWARRWRKKLEPISLYTLMDAAGKEKPAEKPEPAPEPQKATVGETG